MQDYDFKALNDKEFEVLCTDLISAELGSRFERFKPGRDKGVDGRFFSSSRNETIIQCKHWANTSTQNLINDLIKKELPKVHQLKPNRYIIIVSTPLSRGNKSSIAKAFSPHIKSEADIYGREDLNDILSRNKAIELRHYKLWISSTAVVQYLLNKPISDRSAFAVEEALLNSKTYAITSNHEKALEKLESLGIIIITGEPGIGKTTLAEQLCLNYAANDFQIIKISEEIREAESLFDPDSKQVFYFDDFLGRNYLEALSGHEGSHIVQFIRRISKDKKSKAFILTSRSTILNQGKILIDLLKSQNIEKNEYELSASQLTELDKAKILYNQMWHSGLPKPHIEAIYERKRYREIIKNRNFNPRLIKFILDPERISHIPIEDYWSYIYDTLQNPADVWENPFTAQQDDFSRALTLIVTMNGRGIQESELSEVYSRYISLSENSSLKGRRDFLTNMRHLTGSLLNRKILPANKGAMIDLFNPSLGDYLLARYANDIPALRAVFISLRSLTSLVTLDNLTANRIITKLARNEILELILDRATSSAFGGYHSEYISKILVTLEDQTIQKDTKRNIRKAITFISTEPIPRAFENTAAVMKAALSRELINLDTAKSFIISACDNVPNFQELEYLLGIYQDISLNSSPIDVVRCHLGEAITSYLEENVHEEFEDGDVFYGADFYDTSIAKDNLTDLIESKLNKMGVDWNIENESIIDAYNIYARREYYFSPDDDSSHNERAREVRYTDEIDDLFSRDD